MWWFAMRCVAACCRSCSLVRRSPSLISGGTVVVEAHLRVARLGNYFINANLNRDEPLIIGIVAFMSIAVLVFNLLVDVPAFFDPRIRY